MWIYCNEKLPSEDVWQNCIVLLLDIVEGRYFVRSACFCDGKCVSIIGVENET